jgi:hypothetical protein
LQIKIPERTVVADRRFRREQWASAHWKKCKFEGAFRPGLLPLSQHKRGFVKLVMTKK